MTKGKGANVFCVIKTWAVFFLFLAFAGVIFWRLWDLQIKDGEYYQALALGQHIDFSQNNSQRGLIILEKSDFPLAQQKQGLFLFIWPDKIPANQLEEQLSRIAQILKIDEASFVAEFREKKSLKIAINQEQTNLIKQEPSEGILISQLSQRFYPQNNFASHLLGFVNEDGQGQYGLEGYYNNILTGQKNPAGKERSPFGYLANLFEIKKIDAVQDEASLSLTLDYKIQYFAEKLLEKAKDDWQINDGQIIITEPTTGRILTMASLNSFNPNDFNQEKDMAVFSNPCLQELFEPGSVFKPLAMSAGIEEGVVTPETTYQDKGFVDVGGPLIRNFEQKVWGEKTMTQVLENSINTGMVFVEQALGSKLFFKYLNKFGLFENTGIDLQGEVFSANNPLKRGYARDLATASFGQGIEITPIQLVRAFAVLANGGKLMKPYLVEKIIASSGQETINQPQEQGQVISPETSLAITKMLISVVEKGSGMPAKINGYYIAGKTGTAQIAKKQGGYLEEGTIQSFIGYFPAFSPKYLILVKLDWPKDSRMAGLSAGPIFRAITKHIIELYQIPPDY